MCMYRPGGESEGGVKDDGPLSPAEGQKTRAECYGGYKGRHHGQDCVPKTPEEERGGRAIDRCLIPPCP